MNFDSGRRYSLALLTGTMAAALAANSPIFGMRLNPTATVRARIDRLRLQWVTIAAFTVPVTAARRLEVIRARGAALAGGTLATDEAQTRSFDATSQFDDGNGGDVRIATTAALTAAGVTFDPLANKIMTLSHVGAAGAFQDREYIMHPDQHDEIVLAPGELLVVRNPVLMDAGGTFQLAVEIDWREVPIVN